MRTANTTDFVDRQRLRARIERSVQRPVTVIVAPPGCGKSVALTQFLTGSDRRWLRYDVRAENDGILGFLRGLAEAIVPHEPLARAGVLEAVTTALASPAPARTLADRMATHLESYRGIIAIDDLHLCQNEQICIDFLVHLIHRTKDDVRWILASRSSLHLPVAAWVAYGDACVEIGEEDLRFTSDEAAAVAEAAGVELPSGVVEQLVVTTSGWATALTLALRVAEVSTDPSRLRFAARDLSYRYLADHVYRSFAPEERGLLHLAAVLPEIDVRVLEACGIDRPYAMLEDLRERLHLITPSGDDERSGRYRFHDLFREFLLHQLDLLGGENTRAIRIRAARGLLGAGDHVAALRLFAAAGAHGEAIEVLRHHGFAMGINGHGDSLLYTIGALPNGMRETHPVVLAMRGMLEVLAGRYGDGAALLETALAATPPRDRILRAMIVARASVCRFNLGREPLPEVRELAEDSALPLFVQGDLLSIVAIARARSSDFEGLSNELDRIERLAARIDAPYTKATMLQRVGVAGVYSGELERSLRVLPLATALARDCGMCRAATFTLMTLGSALLLNGAHPAEAYERMREAREAADRAQEPHYRLAATIGMLDAAFLIADTEQLRALLGECKELGIERLDPGSAAKVDALLAAVHGDAATAYACMKRSVTSAHFNEYPLLGRALLVLFALLTEDDAIDGAHRDLADAISHSGEAPASKRFLGVARATFAYAAAIRAGDRARSIDTARALKELHYPVLSKLVSLVEGGVPEAPPATLTPAERSVLHALDTGKSPKEIASEQGCSVNTVRWHIRRAIEKFDCSGSAQAVRLARDRGLI